MTSTTTSTATTATTTTNRPVILKFGGTSVATGPRWQNILAQARARADEGLRPVIVCSAITKMTDMLEKLVNEAVRRLTAKGAPRVLLLTAVQNEAAQKLFAKLGFRTTMLEMTREADLATV